ncbi:hypothetical protein Cabys_2021 [Caldithrix abyssi DSM 13497]|uniref:Uncharacterized protein n=1 Tax=Caldithrix abyssi DSM 13497 TaxID=880073 RepID=A0A1J1C9V0_CALAY|nr:hypothetical protein Cabys_2021 [Caldithrix abyssi DSM 13497]
MNHDLLDFGISMICILCLQNFALKLSVKLSRVKKIKLILYSF